MLKLIAKSSNKKLGAIASTYRAGSTNVFGTCPSTCPLKTEHNPGTNEIDSDYLAAVLGTVPRNGKAWTYTHFPKEQIPKPNPALIETTINISTDSIEDARASFLAGYPTVVVRPSDETEKVDEYDSVKFVRCPAEYVEEVTCQSCGGNSGPLCHRPFRNFVVKFTAHGASKKRIGTGTGGCYGSGGPVALQWRGTMRGPDRGVSDGVALAGFVAGLPEGTILRHHVLGDLGRET